MVDHGLIGDWLVTHHSGTVVQTAAKQLPTGKTARTAGSRSKDIERYEGRKSQQACNLEYPWWCYLTEGKPMSLLNNPYQIIGDILVGVFTNLPRFGDVGYMNHTHTHTFGWLYFDLYQQEAWLSSSLGKFDILYIPAKMRHHQTGPPQGTWWKWNQHRTCRNECDLL